jgi:hypothetical protein
LTFRAPNGAFRRTAETDLAATAQALSALAAVRRAESGKVSFYDMSDVTAASDAAGKPSDAVKPLTVTKPGTTFTDIRGHENQKAIETLASCGVIGGMGGGLFAPDASMTRAQFAKIVVSALGLTPEYRATFRDTPKSAWFSPCVDTAAAYGIVKGVGAGKFNPNGTITRQDAAVMVARAAKLCGLDTAVDADAVRGALCGYSDYAAVSDYAAGSLAFCCRAGILTGTGSRIDPLRPVLRGEIAQMLCNMLIQAGLLK